MKPIQMSLRLVTPAFLGGVRQESDCEWRAASVRGQLRWWLRAVAGGVYRGDLQRTKKAEEAVFGSTGQASPVVVQLSGKAPTTQHDSFRDWGRKVGSDMLGELWGIGEGEEPRERTVERLKLGSPVNPVHYLAGPGLVWKNKLTRLCLEPGISAELTLKLRPGRRLCDEHRRLLEHALWAWLHLGGLGARGRRGFGSLAVSTTEDSDGFQAATTRVELVSGIQALLGQGAGHTAMPEWSHLSEETRVCLATEGYPSWDEAMVHAGAWMMGFRRRYGLATDPAEQRDYHWAKEAKYHKKPRGIPDRAGFGLPLPFGKPDNERVTWGQAGTDRRRASPLHLHIAQLEEGFVPVFTHLQARLVPKREDVRFQKPPAAAGPPTKDQTTIVACFLDDLVVKNKLEGLTP